MTKIPDYFSFFKKNTFLKGKGCVVFHFVKFWSSLREKRAALFCPSQRKGKLENRQSCLFLLSPFLL